MEIEEKILPRIVENPTAKIDKEGNMITNPLKLKNVYIDYYKDLLNHKDILPNLKNYKWEKTFLNLENLQSKCKSRMEQSWTSKLEEL